MIEPILDERELASSWTAQTVAMGGDVLDRMD